jgi:2-aminoethylphosphonate-pyruvate transaminase
MPNDIPGWKDDVLFTPGPLTTSRTVKQAMLRDAGSRDDAFIAAVADIRSRLLAVAGVAKDDYEAVLMQGSGTFGVEAVFASTVPRDGKVLVAVNGAYGQRMAKMCAVMGIACDTVVFAEHDYADPAAIDAALVKGGYSHLAVVHCETTTGIVNDIAALGATAHKHGVTYFVDAMSSFGAIPIDFAACHIDYLVSSANKCIEGVPGFSFCIAKKEKLLATDGLARSLSFDLLAQWKGLESNGQFRFTPPTHALLAFHQALLELEQEGGVPGRAARYRTNYETLIAGMAKLGFTEYLSRDKQGYIITSFRYPADPKFDFEAFYTALKHRGYVIYPGKVSDADCFRIGNIGRVFAGDIQGLLHAIGDVVAEMGVTL